jgi:SARP family transcriptional regulator, regulator of embCAB operon
VWSTHCGTAAARLLWARISQRKRELLPSLRIFLAGPVAIFAPPATVVLEADFPSRQARRAFAYLVCSRFAGATSEQIASAVWPADPPPAWRPAVAALISKLRQLFAARLDGAISISSDFGVYRVHIPNDAWIDVDAAVVAAERAVAARRSENLEECWANATIAACISQRALLPGDEGAWIESTRETLRQSRISALDCLLHVQLQAGMPEDAVHSADDLVKLDPYRDQAYIGLMRAVSAAGNPSRAIAVYHQLRHLLADELGIDPSHEAEALYLEILRRNGDTASGLAPVLP